MPTRYLNQALPSVLAVFVFLCGSTSLATQTPPLTEDFDELYVYTIPTLPLHENAALSASTARVSDSPAQRDADPDPDANEAAPFQWKPALQQAFFFYQLYAHLPARD